MLRAIILSIALCLVPASLGAQIKSSPIEPMTECTPGSVDGSQVFVNVWLDGRCVGSLKNLLYIADYTLEALCTVRGFECQDRNEMHPVEDAAKIELYERLKQYRHRTVARPRVGYRIGGTYWKMEMITGGDAPFIEQRNGARGYDIVFKFGCVYAGSTKVGCIKLKGEKLKLLD